MTHLKIVLQARTVQWWAGTYDLYLYFYYVFFFFMILTVTFFIFDLLNLYDNITYNYI